MDLQAFPCRGLGRGLILAAASVALFAVAATDARACATCVSATECVVGLCEGAQMCTFDGPEVETKTEMTCSLLYKAVFGCGGSYSRRMPSCRPSGGDCRSALPECNPQSDLEPDIVDPTSPIGDDEDGPGESPSA